VGDPAGRTVVRRANEAFRLDLLFSTLQDSVFGSLYRASLDDLPSWLRLEYRRLFRERIDALPRFCGGLLDHHQFGEAGHKERSRFLEFFVAYSELFERRPAPPCATKYSAPRRSCGGGGRSPKLAKTVNRLLTTFVGSA
jgi:hypothetical protein